MKRKIYEIVLMDGHEEDIKQIFEIDDKNFIFCISEYISISLADDEHIFL